MQPESAKTYARANRTKDYWLRSCSEDGRYQGSSHLSTPGPCTRIGGRHRVAPQPLPSLSSLQLDIYFNKCKVGGYGVCFQ